MKNKNQTILLFEEKKMKKFIISLMLVLVSFAAFADGRKFDERGNLSGVKESEMNGALYSATIHFASKNNLYFADYTKDKLFFYITDGEEAYLIPNAEISQVFWKYPIEISDLNVIIEDDCNYVISLLYELRNGNSYIPHTEYEVYENYIKALERGEDASYIGEIRIVTTK